ncbi:MAG: tetratricopeptide repeat protein, partial [Deltaproteobacteria bacterium]|nr:tetratricopeptide repeat protein [Deltaproteobacteria bacterium]
MAGRDDRRSVRRASSGEARKGACEDPPPASGRDSFLGRVWVEASHGTPSRGPLTLPPPGRYPEALADRWLKEPDMERNTRRSGSTVRGGPKSRRGLPLLWLLALATGILPLPDASAERTASATASDDLDQARHYFKRGRLEEALRALKAVLATEKGRENARVQLLAAQIYRDHGEIDLAFRALSKAREFGDESEKGSADELYRSLTRSFGEVRILPASGVHVRGRIYLESTEAFINVERKTLFQGVQRSLLVKPRSYPDSIWIPYGEYKANGVKFKHEQGERTEVLVRFPRIAVIRSAARELDRPAIQALRVRI